MKFLRIALSTSLLFAAAGTAAAKPFQPGTSSRPGVVDRRTQPAPLPPPVVAPPVHVPPVISPPIRPVFNPWRPFVYRRWTALATIDTTGKNDVITIKRTAHAVDALRLTVNRGRVKVKAAIVTFANGARLRVRLGEILTAGETKLINIPGPARKLARVELQYADLPGRARYGKAILTLSAR